MMNDLYTVAIRILAAETTGSIRIALISALIALVSALLGALATALAGYFVRKREAENQSRKAQDDLWRTEKQNRWSPLLEAARELHSRFAELKARCRTPNWDLQGDFCELYVLNRGEAGRLDANLEEGDPLAIAARRDGHDVMQATRVRMSHQLNYATSSLYITAKYLGVAERVRRDLKVHLLSMPPDAADKMVDLVSKVREALQGKGSAGMFVEQQESIGETVWGPDDHIITNGEFRKRLLEPGWEHFVGLFRFFVHFHKKVEYEVTWTINALGPLIHEVNLLCECKSALRLNKC